MAQPSTLVSNLLGGLLTAATPVMNCLGFSFAAKHVLSYSIFNNSSIRAAAKLKYKPKIVDGNPVKVDDVMYRFKYEMEEDD